MAEVPHDENANPKSKVESKNGASHLVVRPLVARDAPGVEIVVASLEFNNTPVAEHTKVSKVPLLDTKFYIAK